MIDTPLTGGLVAWRRRLSKSMNHIVRSVGEVSTVAREHAQNIWESVHTLLNKKSTKEEPLYIVVFNP